MNDKNPYLGIVILWITAMSISLTACVFAIINKILWQAFFELALVIVDSVFLGWSICKYYIYKNVLETRKKLMQELEKTQKILEENKVFKEYEK